MKFRIRFANQVVGAFILAAVGFLVVILISIGANQRWFAKNYFYQSTFPSANGLSVGMPIQFRGFEIGKIRSITLNDKNFVDVRFYIQDNYIDKVYEHSILELVSNPLGLGGGLIFHQGRVPSEPPPEGTTIPSLNTKEARALIQQNLVVVPRQDDQIASILAQVEPVLGNVNRVLISLDEVMNQMSEAFAGTGVGPVASILEQTDEALANITIISDNLAATTTELRDPRGMVPMLLDAEGSLETLLNDNNALYDQIEGILVGLNQTVGEVQQITEFFNDSTPQLAGLLEEGRQAISTGQEVLVGLRNNPLLRGGIPETLEQPTTVQSYRDSAF
jgi:phospholipid/cholesterol/gamma-HCH transport system substrate-binding protein